LQPLAGHRADCDLSPTASRQLWHVPWDALAFARQAATSGGHRKLSMYAYSVTLPTGVIGGPAGQQMRPRRTTGTAQQGPQVADGESPGQAVPLFADEIAAGADLAGPQAA
jgi:hypothetical protein